MTLSNQPNHPLSLRQSIGLSASICVALLVIYRHFFFPWGGSVGGDIIGVQTPFLCAFQRQLLNGPFPMWFSEICAGVPAIPDVSATLLHPLYQTLRWLSVPTVIKLQVLLHLLIAFWGCRAWLLLWGRPPREALVWSGVALCLMPVQALLHFGHLGILSSVSILPWALVFSSRLGREGGRANAFGLGLCCAGLWLLGHPQMGLWIHELCLCVLLCCTRDGKRSLVLFSLSVLIGLGLAMPQLLPTVFHILQSERMDSLADADFLNSGAISFPQLLRWFHPQCFGSELNYWGQHTYWYGVLFSSPVLLALSAIGFLKLKLSLKLTLIGLLLLSLGDLTPLYVWHQDWVPGAKLFRYPSRFLLLMGPFLLLALAQGWSVMSGRAWPKPLLVVILSLGFVGVLLPFLDNEQLSAVIPERVLQRRTATALDLPRLCIFAQALLLFFYRRPLRWPLFGVVGCQVLLWSASTFPRVQGGSLIGAGEFLLSNPVVRQHDNRGLLIAQDTLEGYVGMSPSAYRKFLDTQVEQDFSKRNRMQTAGLSPEMRDHMELGQRQPWGEVRTSAHLGKRYHLAASFQPLVMRQDSLHREHIEGQQRLLQSGFEERFGQNTPLGEGRLNMLSFGSDEILLSSASSHAEVLVGLDNTHPIWKVEVDGIAQKIHPWLGTFRSVFLPPGEHRVRFYIDRSLLWWGFGLQIMTAMVMLWTIHKQRKRKSDERL
jgi:hypothetical protein